MNMTWKYPSPNLLLENQYVTISEINLAEDFEALYKTVSVEDNDGEDLLKYHLNAPIINDKKTFHDLMETKLSTKNQLTYKVFSKRLNRIVGCFSLINIKIEHGTIEVGSIWYESRAQKTEINSNTMLLLFSYIFEELGYRRLEWKCNNLNEASKAAAIRLGFEYEGLFRQHFISRGENRDTAWYSIIDKEWNTKKAELLKKMKKYV